jgi:uncharacterized membrane protein YeaQ/YmgE (transglycosylase-associated protein family)
MTTPGQKENNLEALLHTQKEILGLIAGFIGSKLVNKSGEGIVLDILLGIVGAIVGGWLFSRFGAPGVTGLNLSSILVAVSGSVAVLVVYHILRRAT